MPSSTPTIRADKPEQGELESPPAGSDGGNPASLQKVLADGDGGKLDAQLRHPSHDVGRERVAVRSRPQAILVGVGVRIDRFEDLRNRSGRFGPPKLTHEVRRLAVPVPVRQVGRGHHDAAAPPATPSHHLVDRVAGGILRLGRDPGMGREQTPPVECARRPDGDDRFRRLARRRRDGGAGPVRRPPVLPEPRRAAGQGQHRTDQHECEKNNKLAEPAHDPRCLEPRRSSQVSQIFKGVSQTRGSRLRVV